MNLVLGAVRNGRAGSAFPCRLHAVRAALGRKAGKSCRLLRAKLLCLRLGPNSIPSTLQRFFRFLPRGTNKRVEPVLPSFDPLGVVPLRGVDATDRMACRRSCVIDGPGSGRTLFLRRSDGLVVRIVGHSANSALEAYSVSFNSYSGASGAHHLAPPGKPFRLHHKSPRWRRLSGVQRKRMWNMKWPWRVRNRDRRSLS